MGKCLFLVGGCVLRKVFVGGRTGKCFLGGCVRSGQDCLGEGGGAWGSGIFVRGTEGHTSAVCVLVFLGGCGGVRMCVWRVK